MIKKGKSVTKTKETNWNHPLLSTLKTISPPLLHELFIINSIWHVACYVVTASGLILVQKRGGNLFTERIQSFGGCNYPNHLAKMINSLRLELMDECGLLLDNNNLILSSPPIIIPDRVGATLLQIFLVKDESVVDCWSAERARKILGDNMVPSDAGLKDFVDEEVKSKGRIIFKQSIADAKTMGKWRKCDLDSLNMLENKIEQMIEAIDLGDELILLNKPGTSKELWNKLVKLKKVFDSPGMKDFRTICKLPWSPILWDEASRVFRTSAEEFLKLT